MEIAGGSGLPTGALICTRLKNSVWTGLAPSCDLTGKQNSGAPLWSGYVRGEYARAWRGNLQAGGGIEYNFRSGSYYSADDSLYALIAGYGLVNLHVDLGSTARHWQASVWARNLLNKEYFATLAAGSVLGAGYVTGLPGDPRTYGLSVRLQF